MSGVSYLKYLDYSVGRKGIRPTSIHAADLIDCLLECVKKKIATGNSGSFEETAIKLGLFITGPSV